MMVRVAVAGGTGGLGRTLVECIANMGEHDVFVLTRSATSMIAGHRCVRALVVNYSSPAQIADVLRTENIDTVISAIGIFSEQARQAQENLIEGAKLSETVERFAPSEYGWDYVEALKHDYPPSVAGLGAYKTAWYKAEAIQQLRKTDMQYTRYIIGFLLDYFGFPYAPVGVFPLAVVLDMENAKAAIPGNGNTPVIFTHSRDVGECVARSLSMPYWPEKLYIVGDRRTWNEVLALAEQARGIKFDVSYDSEVDMRESHVTELPANVARYAVFSKAKLDGLLAVWGIGFAEGWFNLPQKTLGEAFPDVWPFSVENFLNRCWKGKTCWLLEEALLKYFVDICICQSRFRLSGMMKVFQVLIFLPWNSREY